jgi:type IV pilus assembly protein PilC
MPKFQYSGFNTAGKAIKGTADAMDDHNLYLKLQETGIFATTIEPVQQRSVYQRLKLPAVVSFCTQMGTLLHAGVSLVRALNILSLEEGLSESTRAVFDDLQAQIRQGIALSVAMGSQAPAFPELLVQMVAAAETSGSLDQTLTRMGEYFEKDYRMSQKIGGAMTYPMILGLLTLAAVVIIVTFVIPQFGSLFETGRELPLPTRVVMQASEFMSHYWYIAIVVSALFVFLMQTFIRLPQVAYELDEFKIRFGPIKRLMRTIYTARFARTLSSLYSSGMPVLLCLQVGKTTVGNRFIAAQFEDVIVAVRRGGTLADAVGRIDGFVQKLTSTIYVGEETGNLEHMLNVISTSLDYESEISLTKMTTMVEPIMLIVMAVIIGFVMLAVMMPIFQMYGSIK